METEKFSRIGLGVFSKGDSVFYGHSIKIVDTAVVDKNNPSRISYLNESMSRFSCELEESPLEKSKEYGRIFQMKCSLRDSVGKVQISNYLWSTKFGIILFGGNLESNGSVLSAVDGIEIPLDQRQSWIDKR